MQDATLEYTKAINADLDVDIEPWDMSVNDLRVTIHGKEGTPYDDGRFVFQIKLDGDHLPLVYCHTLIWHPNIDNSIPSGKNNVCHPLLNPSSWNENVSLVDIINILKSMIYMEEPHFHLTDPVNEDVTQRGFTRKASNWTEKYAKA